MCVCVCVREREREKDRHTERYRKTETDRDRGHVISIWMNSRRGCLFVIEQIDELGLLIENWCQLGMYQQKNIIIFFLSFFLFSLFLSVFLFFLSFSLSHNPVQFLCISLPLPFFMLVVHPSLPTFANMMRNISFWQSLFFLHVREIFYWSVIRQLYNWKEKAELCDNNSPHLDFCGQTKWQTNKTENRKYKTSEELHTLQ